MTTDERLRKTGESPLEYAKRMYRPLMSVDELVGLEREGRDRIIRKGRA